MEAAIRSNAPEPSRGLHYQEVKCHPRIWKARGFW